MPVGHVLAQFWAKLESTFDTATAFAAADAINVEELTIEPSFEWEVINEHVGTASMQSECAGVEAIDVSDGPQGCGAFVKIQGGRARRIEVVVVKQIRIAAALALEHH